MKAAAALLIVIGIGIVIWGAFGFTTKKKVLDIGPIEATKEEKHDVPFGPIAGGLIAVAGVALLIKSK